ncbi:MAG: carbohydrate kinase [Planctomycetaceae bacterium]|nr:MAG: carbohydrate kinase [Planctomycetaceae bacterium]
MTDVQMAGLGEVLWDCFPTGRKPGGAPANVAYHVQQLGLPAAVLSRVGNDPLGAALLDYLQQHGLSTGWIQRDACHPTGTVTVSFAEGQPRYIIHEPAAWDALDWTAEWQGLMSHIRALSFGTLAQRSSVSRETLYACLQATSATCLRVYDINLRPPFVERRWLEQSLELATVAKCNQEEARWLAQLWGAPVDQETAFAPWLAQRFGLQAVVVTRGERGVLAWIEGRTYDLPGISVAAVDPVGAGDAFTAGFIYGWLQQWEPWATLTLANRLGALVASLPGAMPPIRPHLSAIWHDLPSPPRCSEENI